MQLSNLNDDLICEIADGLPPTEAIAFALCNKRFHALSSPRLKRHKEYQRKYSHLHITGATDGNPADWTADSPLRALCQISNDPDRAYYLRRVEYKPTEPSDMIWYSLEDNDDLIEFMDHIPDCLAKCKFLDEEEKDDWFEVIMAGFWGEEPQEDHCCASGRCLVLLLSLLPNIQFLELSNTLPCLGGLEDLVEYIGQNPDEDDVPLSKLRTLFVESTPTMGLIFRLLSIPSVRQLYVSNVIEQLDGWSMGILEQCDSSSLRIIGLADTALPPPVLTKLVEKSPHLQSLTLAWDESMTFPCGCTVDRSDESQLLDHAFGGRAELEKLFASKGYSMRYTEDEETMYGLRIFDIDVHRKVYVVPLSNSCDKLTG